MTSPDVELVHTAIAEAVEPAGFRKKGSTWYGPRPDALLVINLQKSQYAARYYLNLGLYWRSLGEKTAPREEECHLRGRISSVPGTVERELDRLLDFEDASLDDRTRLAALQEAVSQHALPLLERCSTAAGLREEHRKGALKSFLLTRSLMAAIGLQ